MAYYGITNESELIDYATIKKGCEKYIDSLNDVLDTGKAIYACAQMFTKDTMEIDGMSMENLLYELGKTFTDVANEYATYANDLYEQAIKIYNAQVTELNEYNRKQAQQAQQTGKSN